MLKKSSKYILLIYTEYVGDTLVVSWQFIEFANLPFCLRYVRPSRKNVNI